MNALMEQTQSLLARLSRREKLLVGGAALAAVLLITLVVALNVQGAMADRRSRIAFKREGLEQVAQLSSGFRAAQADRNRLAPRLRQNVSLVSFVEELSRKAGVSVTNMTPRQPVTEQGVTEQTVDVSLEGVRLDNLTAIVNGLQTSPGVVKLRRLRVRKKLNSEDTVDATLTVATYSTAG